MSLGNRRKKGFTLIELMVAIAIGAILTAMSLPSIMKAKAEAKLNACVHNLETIAKAVEQCRIRHPELLEGTRKGKQYLVEINEDCFLVELGYLKSVPKCPNGGYYSYKYSGGIHGDTYEGYYHIAHNTENHHTDAGLKSYFPYFRSDVGICYYDRYH